MTRSACREFGQLRFGWWWSKLLSQDLTRVPSNLKNRGPLSEEAASNASASASATVPNVKITSRYGLRAPCLPPATNQRLEQFLVFQKSSHSKAEEPSPLRTVA
jgi:hypothetical protein